MEFGRQRWLGRKRERCSARWPRGKDPAEDRQLDRKAMTVGELGAQYIKAVESGLIMRKGRRPKRQSTVSTDIGQRQGHVLPLIGKRPVHDLTKADVTRMMNDVIAGKTRAVRKTGNKRGKSVRQSGPGAAKKCVGLTGAMLSYGSGMGLVDHNVARGIRKP